MYFVFSVCILQICNYAEPSLVFANFLGGINSRDNFSSYKKVLYLKSKSFHKGVALMRQKSLKPHTKIFNRFLKFLTLL